MKEGRNGRRGEGERARSSLSERACSFVEYVRIEKKGGRTEDELKGIAEKKKGREEGRREGGRERRGGGAEHSRPTIANRTPQGEDLPLRRSGSKHVRFLTVSPALRHDLGMTEDSQVGRNLRHNVS